MNKLTNKNKILKKVYLKGLSVSLSILTVTVFPVNAADNNTANNQPAAQETKQEINLKEKIGEKLKAIANNRAVRIAVGIGGVAAVVGVACALCKNNSKVTGTGAMKFSEAPLPLPEGIKDNERYLNEIHDRLRSIRNDIRQLQDNVGYGSGLWRPLFDCGNNIEGLLPNGSGGYYLTVERLEHINAQVVGFLENMRDLRNDSRRDPGVSRRLRNICDKLVNLANFTGSNISLDNFLNVTENLPAVQPGPQSVNSQVNPSVQPRSQPINLQVNPPVQQERQTQLVNEPVQGIHDRLGEARNGIEQILNNILNNANNDVNTEQLDQLLDCQDKINLLLNETSENQVLTDIRRDNITDRLMSCLRNIRDLYRNHEIRGRVGQELSNLFDRLVDLVHFIDPNRNRVVPPLQRQPEPQPVNSQVNPPVQQEPQPQPVNLPVYEQINQLPGTLRLSENGYNIYIQNMITRQEVDIRDEGTIGNKLHELCTQFNITSGTYSGGNSLTGWERTPYQYYFCTEGTNLEGVRMRYVHLYAWISDLYKQRFAQMIQLVYDHRSEENWQGAIRNFLLGLCEHDGHCDTRAVALVEQAYNNLLTNIINDNLDPHPHHEDRDNMPLLNEMFSRLKESLVGKVQGLYMQIINEKLQRLQNENKEEARSFQNSWEYTEPLYAARRVISAIKRTFGMSNDDVEADINREETVECFNRLMAKNNLIEEAHKIVASSMIGDSDKLQQDFFKDVDSAPLSFREYCSMVGKTHEDEEHLIAAARDSGDADLVRWVNDETSLKLDDEEHTSETIFGKLMLFDDFAAQGIPECNYCFGIKFIRKCCLQNYLLEI